MKEYNTIKVYGADWCGDCKRAMFQLDAKEMKYEYIDIDTDPEAKEFIKQVNPNGYESIPVIVFDNNDVLIEPTSSELISKLQQLIS